MPEDLLAISNKELTVETAITKTMSFQNIGKICAYFRDLDTRLDLAGTLKKPYKGQVALAGYLPIFEESQKVLIVNSKTLVI